MKRIEAMRSQAMYTESMYPRSMCDESTRTEPMQGRPTRTESMHDKPMRDKPTQARTAARRALGLAAACAAMLSATAAQAHYLWIERDGQAVRVFFGEYEEAVHERSPGRLDEIPGPRLRSADGDALALTRGPDGFRAAPPRARPAALVLEETGVPVKDWSASGIGVVKPMFYARHADDAAPVEATLPLDIVPAGRPGAFRVVFRGAPAAKTKVTVVAPNGWTQEASTDASGQVTLPMPWRGQYLIQAIHREPVAGEFGGSRYDAVRHRTVLTISSPTGAATFVPRFAR